VQFASGTSTSQEAFEVDIDDFLLNLRELAAWPANDPDIYWQPELLRLVEANVQDAASVHARLVRPDADMSPASAVAGWTAELTAFQARDMARLLTLAHGANFSVPGAGKTRVTLACFHARRERGEVRRLLVVCPKAAFESWQTETALCFPVSPLRIAIMDGPVPPFADIVLINYERLPDAHAALVQWLRAQAALLVLDEAHRMKLGAAGAWGSTCFALGPYAARRMILTGTPAPNGPKDLENLFSFVWPGQGRAEVVRALAGKDLRSASARLRPLFVRTTKRELNLPDVQIKLHRVELPRLHRELYQALLGQASAQSLVESNLDALGRVVLYLLMAATTPALLATGGSRHEPLPYRVPPLQAPEGSTLFELMRDLPLYELPPKYAEAAAIVAANAALGRKTLIWSTFVRNLTSLAQLLARFRPAIVHGGSEDRAEQLARFRHDPECLVLLSNPATLGEGVSLHQVCHDSIYIDRDFAAGRFTQSLDRIHRLGLAHDVETRITILAAAGTIDEVVEQRLASKLRFLGAILDDPAVLQLGDLEEEPSATAGMDQRDVQALLQHITRNVPA
jgi:SNF2 family DNA or RNA helicase